MKENTPKSPSLRGAIRTLPLGGSVTFPAERTCYLRSNCSAIGFELSRRFTTRIDREARTITVTRTE